MNIFVLSHDPTEAGRLLCDEHLRECGIYYTQLLVNQHNTHKKPDERAKVTPTGVYTSPQKVDHPCNKWVAEGDSNYMWMWELTKSVWSEYRFRFGVEHPCKSVFEADLGTPPKLGKTSGQTSPPICLPLEWQPEKDKKGGKLWACIDAYRGYYKFIRGTWTKRPEPDWMTFPSNRHLSPFDKQVQQEIHDREAEIVRRRQEDEAFRQHKAIVDAKYRKQPSNYRTEPGSGFRKTFKRIY